MLSNSEGREISCLNIDKYIDTIKATLDENKEQRILVAISGLNRGTPQEYRNLVERVRELGDNVKIFVGTNSFHKEGQSQEAIDKEIREIYEVLKLADFVSMNDEETHAIYNAVYEHKDIPLAEKFSELELKGVRVTHSAEGALLYCNVPPETLFDDSITQNFPRNMQKFLQWAVDGTSLAYQDGIMPNFTQTEIYSKNVRERQYSPFDVKYLTNKALSITLKQVKNGIIRAAAPEVRYAKGGLTGLGAIFDGILTAFFMSKITKRR